MHDCEWVQEGWQDLDMHKVFPEQDINLYI